MGKGLCDWQWIKMELWRVRPIKFKSMWINQYVHRYIKNDLVILCALMKIIIRYLLVHEKKNKKYYWPLYRLKWCGDWYRYWTFLIFKNQKLPTVFSFIVFSLMKRRCWAIVLVKWNCCFRLNSLTNYRVLIWWSSNYFTTEG